jgi:hypothetical protein
MSDPSRGLVPIDFADLASHAAPSPAPVSDVVSGAKPSAKPDLAGMSALQH